MFSSFMGRIIDNPFLSQTLLCFCPVYVYKFHIFHVSHIWFIQTVNVWTWTRNGSAELSLIYLFFVLRDDFNISVLQAFVELHEFADLNLVQALRWAAYFLQAYSKRKPFHKACDCISYWLSSWSKPNLCRQEICDWKRSVKVDFDRTYTIEYDLLF